VRGICGSVPEFSHRPFSLQSLLLHLPGNEKAQWLKAQIFVWRQRRD
jgi:hypothetical protein